MNACNPYGVPTCRRDASPHPPRPATRTRDVSGEYRYKVDIQPDHSNAPHRTEYRLWETWLWDLGVWGLARQGEHVILGVLVHTFWALCLSMTGWPGGQGNTDMKLGLNE